MKKIITLAAIIIITPLILTGCGKSISEQIGEKIAEESLKTTTGQDVDINTEDESVSFKTEDGEMQYSGEGEAKIPEGLPEDLIIASDAKILFSSSASEGLSVSYTTNDSKDTIYNQYLNHLTNSGWSKEMELNTGTGYSLSFTRNIQQLSLTISDNSSSDQEGATMVYLIYAEKDSAE